MRLNLRISYKLQGIYPTPTNIFSGLQSKHTPCLAAAVIMMVVVIVNNGGDGNGGGDGGGGGNGGSGRDGSIP